MSGFTIFLRGEYEESNVFYPYEGWDEIPVDEKGISVEHFDNKVSRVFTQMVLDNLDNEEEFDKLWEMFCEGDIPEELESDPDYDSRRPDYYEGGSCLSVICPYGTFEVSFKDKKKEDIELEWDDLFAEDVDQPSLEDQLSKELSPTPEFCFVKVWENSGGWIFESDDDEEFDQSKIHYVNGQVYYGDIDKLPHLPIDMFNDLMLNLTIFFPRFSEQKVAATLASLRPANFKLYTLAYILLLQLTKHLVN